MCARAGGDGIEASPPESAARSRPCESVSPNPRGSRGTSVQPGAGATMNFSVFKKCSADGKLTMYLCKRDVVDHITFIDPVGKCPRTRDPVRQPSGGGGGVSKLFRCPLCRRSLYGYLTLKLQRNVENLKKHPKRDDYF